MTPTRIPLAARSGLPAVIGSAGKNLVIDYINDDAEDFLGASPGELLGQSVLALVAPEDVPRWLAAIAQATLARAGVTMELHARPAHGPPLTCDAFVLAMPPPPSCAFVLMPSLSGPLGGQKDDIGKHLSRLQRGIQAVSTSADLSTAASGDHFPAFVAMLSARELEIARRLHAGDRVPAIATALFLSQSTVRNHLTHIYRKLGVGSQQELVDLFRHDDRNRRAHEE
ncbi:MAG: hypothetical protein QOI06_2516 [Nocardioidaceae bacterium]|jgi:DNA-binding CsgD family transcriptional regulator|nr:hypothetical protein [Nocardioidaceae bacterium]